MAETSLRQRFVDKLMAITNQAVGRLDALEPRAQLRFTILLDSALCLLATWLAFFLRLGIVSLPVLPFLVVLATSGLVWRQVALRLGFYRSLLRYAGGRTMFDLMWAAIIMSAIMSALFVTLRLDGLPRTLGVLQPLTFAGLLGVSRLVLRFILVDFTGRSGDHLERSVVVYGAGRAGQQLVLSLRHEPHVRVAGYLDDDWRLHGQKLDGLTVHNPGELDQLIQSTPVTEILLAIPSASRARKREIVTALQPLGLSVRSLPPTADILAGHVSVSDLRVVQIEDLLGRDPVPPSEILLGKNIADKVVLVTGAGGSIGSELCRQILASHPRSMVLVDHSEYALYAIEAELSELRDKLGGTRLIPELCNVGEAAAVDRLFARHRPDTVFHSAAYKHVPLIEQNPIAGVVNNVIGTLNCCQAAEKNEVKTFIHISTDKAVRPTNIMGSTKRICELILQARAAAQTGTLFTMVRFGNVLGSSGSVLPKFRAQIAAGGPVTVTNKEVTRYFMTIPEAAQLVIQAGAMAKGGDVFFLDMGSPIRIQELAEAMIRLSGRTVKDANNDDGDIEIVEVGLRPGEKLFEELLLGNDPQTTAHPRIIKAHEEFLPWIELKPVLVELERVAHSGDRAGIFELIKQLVPEYSPTAAENGRFQPLIA